MSRVVRISREGLASLAQFTSILRQTLLTHPANALLRAFGSPLRLVLSDFPEIDLCFGLTRVLASTGARHAANIIAPSHSRPLAKADGMELAGSMVTCHQ